MIRCPACGAENKPSTKFCHECGAAVPGQAAVDDERTVLIPAQANDRGSRAPGTIEQAMGVSTEGRKPGGRPPPTPPDNDMTVVLPKKSASLPKYEPAPPTVTGPLTEPIPRGKSSRAGGGSGKPSIPAAAKKPKTPISVVLALLVVAGGSAGYLGWLILKKNKAAVPAENVAVAPPAAEPAKPPPAKLQVQAEPVPPVAAPAAPAVVAPPAETPPASIAPASPPPTPVPAPKADTPPAPLAAPPSAETPKTEIAKAEKAKAEQLKKEQARLEAAKKEKQKKPPAATAAATSDSARAAESQRPAAPVEPVKQEATPLALLRDELRTCDGQNVFTREFCRQQARQRRCAGMWDRVPECPYKKEDRLY